MATSNELQSMTLLVFVARCRRCEESYTPEDWQQLADLGRHDLGDYQVEMRNCRCGSSITARLTSAPSRIDRLQACIKHMELEHEAVLSSSAALEVRLERANSTIRRLRQKEFAANQEPPPNPPGTVTVIRDLDPSDPNVRLCRRRGG